MSDQVNQEKVARAIGELSKTMDRQLKNGLSPEEGFVVAIMFMGRVIAETEGDNVLQTALQGIEYAVKVKNKVSAS